MQAVGGILLLLGLFALYRMFTVRDFLGGRRSSIFDENVGKLECGLTAALLLFGAFEFIFVL